MLQRASCSEIRIFYMGGLCVLEGFAVFLRCFSVKFTESARESPGIGKAVIEGNLENRIITVD